MRTNLCANYWRKELNTVIKSMSGKSMRPGHSAFMVKGLAEPHEELTHSYK